jgi:hypothetical protein
MSMHTYSVLKTAHQCKKTLKSYTLAGYEPGIFGSGGNKNEK